MSEIDRRLDRLVPPDWRHVEKYPLTTETMPPVPTPVTIGINWYSAFDTPEQDENGRYWVGRARGLGYVRGGHCLCLLPKGLRDLMAWYRWYDQLREGACVGFGISRMMTLLNRRRYDARWLWNEAKARDIWPDTNPGDNNGTSVRAGLDVLRELGHRRIYRGETGAPDIQEGIKENRWARRVDEVLAALGTPERDYVPMLNSWGEDYPHIVYMPATVLDRVLREDGEMGLVTDRVANV